MSLRVTDLNITSHKRLVYRNVIAALQSVFNADYNRENQLVGLKITPNYPLKEVDYPAIVVEYQNSMIENAGVGHVEWFADPMGHYRKWGHRRFEGMLNFTTYTLSPKDRDILVDALTEVISFGSLDSQLNRFYELIYPDSTPPPVAEGERGLDYSYSLFSQLILNSDQIRGISDSATLAPWNPEDVLSYTSGISVEIHGGFYNTNPTVDWSRVTRVVIDAYQTDQAGTDLPFPGHAEIQWNPPFVFEDDATVRGRAVISAMEEHQQPAQETLDAAAVTGQAVISATEAHDDL